MASEKVYVGKAGAQELYRKVKGDIGSLSDTVDGKLALKADQATLDADMASVNEALATKASTSDLESAVSDLGHRIDAKADADTVESELALKADQATLESAVSDLGQRIDDKADVDTVASELALKADQATLDADMASVNAALATKASTSDLESAVSVLGQRIDDKADADTVASELALKEDLANKVTSFGGQPTNVQYPSALLVKTEIDRLQQEIANLGGFEVVTTLVDGHPNPEIPSHKIIYLYKDPQGPEADPYTEWIYTVDNEWDVIGTTYVDLTPYYTSAEVDSLLATKVNTVAGKGLSTNDYTDAEKNKLASIETGAQANVIEEVQVNGMKLPVDANKAVNIPLASATDSGNETVYVTGAVTGQDKQKWDNWASAVFPIIPKPNIVVIGGRAYPTVKIGNQMWMAENLDYKWEGLAFPKTMGEVYSQGANYYNNDEATYGVNGNKYGLLYNWYAANYLNDNRATLLPDGWHVATSSDFNTLFNSVESVDELRSGSGWYQGNGTNESGFNAYPSGKAGYNFQSIGIEAYIACSDQANNQWGWYAQLTKTTKSVGLMTKWETMSIRLVKNLA
jgi:uncharacterized protein (TIGR02145 family)